MWSAYFKQRKRKRRRGLQIEWTLVHSLDREGLLSFNSRLVIYLLLARKAGLSEWRGT